VRSSIPACRVLIIHPPRHAGPAFAHDPDDRPVDASVQFAAQPVVREEGVQVG
jgi:hypothetical protein